MNIYGKKIFDTSSVDQFFFNTPEAKREAEEFIQSALQNNQFATAIQNIVHTLKNLGQLSNALGKLPIIFDNPMKASPELALHAKYCRLPNWREIKTFKNVVRAIQKQLQRMELTPQLQFEFKRFSEVQGKGLSVYTCKLNKEPRVGYTAFVGPSKYQLALDQADAAQGLSLSGISQRIAGMFAQAPNELVPPKKISPDLSKVLCESGPSDHPASNLISPTWCNDNGYFNRGTQTFGAPVLNSNSPLLGEYELNMVRELHRQITHGSADEALERSVDQLVQRMQADFGDMVSGHFASSYIQQLFCTTFSELVVSCASNDRNRMFLQALTSLIGNLLSIVVLSQNWKSVPLSLGSLLGHRLTHTGYALGQLLGAVGLFNLVLGAIRGNRYPAVACVAGLLGAVVGQLMAELLISMAKRGSLQRSEHHQQAMRLIPPEHKPLLLDYCLSCLERLEDPGCLTRTLRSTTLVLRNVDRKVAQGLDRYLGLNGLREFLSRPPAPTELEIPVRRTQAQEALNQQPMDSSGAAEEHRSSRQASLEEERNTTMPTIEFSEEMIALMWGVDEESTNPFGQNSSPELNP